MTTITLGRYPTLGEVIDYYTQEPFLRFLADTLRYRRVVLVISRKKHWEPNWERFELTARTPVGLDRQIRRTIDDVLGDVAPSDRPGFYPAFHQSVWKGDPTGNGEDNRNRYMDCVFEADLPLWRDAFQDVTATAGLFEHYGVPYLHKFSGHRSLHFIVPGDILPQGYRGKSSGKLAHVLTTWSGSQAHHLPKITRMPYSLNEDTGLVCLPINRGDLDAFRVWQANLHLVEIPETAWEPRVTHADKAALVALLADLGDVDGQAPSPVRHILAVPTTAHALDPYRRRLSRLESAGPLADVWQRLHTPQTMPEAGLLAAMQSAEPDIRWLAAEAYVFHGQRLSGAGFEALATEEEEYARSAATDVLLRFRDSLLPHAVEALHNLDDRTTIGATVTYLLTQSPELRESVFARLLAEQGDTSEARLAVACLMGAMAHDWGRAAELVAPLRERLLRAEQSEPVLQKKLKAIEIMQEMGGREKTAEAARVTELAALGSEITDLLLIAANSPDRRFRRGIVSALAEIADPRATDHLIRALDDDYTKVRRRAITGLTRIGEPAVDALIEAADGDQVRTRRYAIVCLGHIGVTRGKSVIIEALNDSEEDVRRQALRALKEQATPDDLEALLQFLREAQPRNAVGALEILEALGPSAIEALQAMAFRELNLAAAYFLADHGDHDARDILVQALETGDEMADDATEYLRELRDPRCVPHLVRRFREMTDWEGMFVAQELGIIGTGKAVSALIEALSRDNHLIRRGAARGLDEAMDPVSIEPLISALYDEDDKTRKQASETLCRFGEAALAPLSRELATVDPDDGRRRSILTRVIAEVEASVRRPAAGSAAT